MFNYLIYSIPKDPNCPIKIRQSPARQKTLVLPDFELWFEKGSVERSIYHNRKKRGAENNTGVLALLYSKLIFSAVFFRSLATPLLTTRHNLSINASQPEINFQSGELFVTLMHNPGSAVSGRITIRFSSNAGKIPLSEKQTLSASPKRLRISVFILYIMELFFFNSLSGTFYSGEVVIFLLKNYFLAGLAAASFFWRTPASSSLSISCCMLL